MRRLLSALACGVIALAVVLALDASGGARADGPVGHYREYGDAGGFLNILPPGQDGVVSLAEFTTPASYTPHLRDQLDMYASLVYASPGITDGELSTYYKDASFGVPEGDIERVYSPTAGVTVVRDRSFGVPHIFGTTRYATMFAQGYTAAEDRLFAMDALRRLGRARLSEWLGASSSNQALDREQLAEAPYTEADLTAQADAFIASGAEGQAIADDLEAYTDGVNAYITEALADASKLPAEYSLLGLPLEPWVHEDAIAIASKVGAIFGKGGGGEVRNHCGLKDLTVAAGSATTARAIFDDLHFANDSEAPTTSPNVAPYMTDLGPVDPAAHPDIDCATLNPVIDDGPSVSAAPYEMSAADAYVRALVEAAGGGPAAMSNALLVAGAHTTTGAPIAVFGPQTGYYSPQLLVEKDVHGPGIDARGAAFAGVDLYVQLGRGTNYAWSATSSGADNVDQWVLELCEPLGGTPTTASMGYMRNSVCEPIETYQHEQTDGVTSLSWRVERTDDYGIISERGTLEDGTPIAIASLRSTYRNELGSAFGFYRLNNPANLTSGFADFRTIMGGAIDYTFNWFYVDATTIGYQHSCLCPQRAGGVDPYLPAWGNGSWDWQGFIGQAAQPYAENPAAGYITSWNNKQAPEFMSNDRQFGFGPVYRNLMLNTRIEAAIGAGDIDRADLVEIMEDAGTVDLRGQELVSLLLDVMGTTAPGGSDPRAQDMRDRLEAWAAAGAHRRDLDHDGAYDDAQAPAIMDAWWPRLVDAMFDASSYNAMSHLGIGLHDAPQGHQGSAFAGGVYSHVNKDLRQVLSLAVSDAWSQTYCGGGVLATCHDALWSSLDDAASALQTEFGSALVADWKRSVASDDIRSTALGVIPIAAFHWINRPTFQQVVQIDAGCAGDADCDTVLDAPDDCPAASNAGQGNNDRNFIDLPASKTFDDVTLANSDNVGDACDPDDDNDGLSDLLESGGPPCAAAASPTDPLLADSDGDRVLDGAECAYGTDPNSSGSVPSTTLCHATGDADADGIRDSRERCFLNTSGTIDDTDVDGRDEQCELASVDNDTFVTVLDLSRVAKHLPTGGAEPYLANMDMDKDGSITVLDLQYVGQRFAPCP